MYVGQYHPDIVVVSDKSSDKQENTTQEELNKLQYVPLFYPILKSSIELKEDRDLFLIDPESVSIFKSSSWILDFNKSSLFSLKLIKLSTELKNHLASCATNATRDQDALTIEIKHVNFLFVHLFFIFHQISFLACFFEVAHCDRHVDIEIC